MGREFVNIREIFGIGAAKNEVGVDWAHVER